MTAAPAHRAAPPGRSAHRVKFGHVLAAEWTKIRTVKSTFWTLLAGAVVLIGFTALWALAFSATFDQMTDTERATFTPMTPIQVAFYFAMVVFGALGVLVITAEYSTGMIRTALTSVPRRAHYLAAKTLVLALVVLAVGVAVTFASFFVAQPILAGKGLDGSIGDPGVLRAVVGGGVWLMLIAVMALALGTLLRHTAGSIVLVFVALFVLGIAGGFLPGSWGATVNEYLPSNAGSAILAPARQPDQLAPWTGLAVFAIYTVVLLAAALVVMERRDA
ncbi:ABC transporter permease [Actinomadura sp. WMMB 499]|uniref:ABC transporter permease n=1 Tax=Actinomadura sp. WMMB 499 TaxID=1219491 RepID=UPI001248F371|nr:ABC transporter permease [Actinomadura sp. WMMB 499]QFG25891.1 ABC transporter permease subunit [Actinomadura sp. WMMB 499]